MKPQEVFKDIKNVITAMIAAGLSDEQRYPSIREVGRRSFEIGIEGAPDLSASLKNESYSVVYTALKDARAFN